MVSPEYAQYVESVRKRNLQQNWRSRASFYGTRIWRGLRAELGARRYPTTYPEYTEYTEERPASAAEVAAVRAELHTLAASQEGRGSRGHARGLEGADALPRSTPRTASRGTP